MAAKTSPAKNPDLQKHAPAAPTPAAPAKRPRGRPPLAPGESKATPIGERMAKYRAKGRQVNAMVMDAAALGVLDAETAKGCTVAEVLAWALIEADRHRT